MADGLETTQSGGDDIGADLANALAQLGSSGDGAPAREAPEPSREGGREPESRDGERRFGRERDESGRFAPTESKSAPRAERGTQKPEQAAPEQGESGEGGETAEQTEPKPALAPPPSWSPAAKASFAELPPLVQQEVAKREVEIKRGLAELQEWNGVKRELAGAFEFARQNNTTVGEVYQRYRQAEQNLAERPVEALLSLCKYAGVHPEQLYFAATGQDPRAAQQQPQGEGEQARQPQQAPQPLYDPRLEQWAAATTRQQQMLQAEIQALKQAPLRQQVESFFSDPKYPYAHNLRDDMRLLLQNERAESLEDAYEKAAWANPEIRALLIEQQAKASAAQTARTQVKSPASNPRAAAKSISGSPVPGASTTPADSDMSIEDIIAQQFRLRRA